MAAGQKPAANSMPVVVAPDQSPIPVSVGGLVVGDGGPLGVLQAGPFVVAVGDGGPLGVTQQGPWTVSVNDGGILSAAVTTIADGGPLAVLQGDGPWSANIGIISDGGALAVTATQAGPFTVAVNDGGPLTVTISDGLNAADVDVFNRLRVGIPLTQADLTLAYEIDARDWGQMTDGGATIAYVANQQAAQLTVTTAANDTAILQTNTYFRYQAGKAHWLRQTLIQSDSGQTNQVRRWGLFDQQNGIFWQLSGTTLSFCQRSFTSGSTVDTCVAQASWNVDKADGTGRSGLNVDVTKDNIWEVQLQWLGAGKVQGSIDGFVVHQFNNPNTLTVPYMTTGTLPVRVEINNTGSSTAANIRYVCTSLESLGGGEPSPFTTFSASNTSDITVGASEVPLIAIRLKSTYNSKVNRMQVLPLAYNIFNNGTSSNGIYARVLFNPTVTGGAWTSTDSTSGVEYNITATSFSGGTQIDQRSAGGVTAAYNDTFDRYFDARSRKLRLDAFGTTSDVLLITGIRTGGTTAGRANISWGEIR